MNHKSNIIPLALISITFKKAFVISWRNCAPDVSASKISGSLGSKMSLNANLSVKVQIPHSKNAISGPDLVAHIRNRARGSEIEVITQVLNHFGETLLACGLETHEKKISRLTGA